MRSRATPPIILFIPSSAPPCILFSIVPRHFIFYLFPSSLLVMTTPTSENDNAGGHDTQKAIVHTRAYQQELLDESLHRNVVIALDTGSGKTHIAVLRMKHEAEREPRKVCYEFMASLSLEAEPQRVARYPSVSSACMRAHLWLSHRYRGSSRQPSRSQNSSARSSKALFQSRSALSPARRNLTSGKTRSSGVRF